MRAFIDKNHCIVIQAESYAEEIAIPQILGKWEKERSALEGDKALEWPFVVDLNSNKVRAVSHDG